MEGDDQPEMYCVMGQMSAWLGVRCPGTWLSFFFFFFSKCDWGNVSGTG